MLYPIVHLTMKNVVTVKYFLFVVEVALLIEKEQQRRTSIMNAPS